jgi:hypothetical protein
MRREVQEEKVKEKCYPSGISVADVTLRKRFSRSHKNDTKDRFGQWKGPNFWMVDVMSMSKFVWNLKRL